MARITVNISNTIGQSSAIEANGGPLFEIEVTVPAVSYPPAKDGSSNNVAGFGRVVSGGPVNGHEICYKAESVVHGDGVQHLTFEAA